MTTIATYQSKRCRHINHLFYTKGDHYLHIEHQAVLTRIESSDRGHTFIREILTETINQVRSMVIVHRLLYNERFCKQFIGPLLAVRRNAREGTRGCCLTTILVFYCCAFFIGQIGRPRSSPVTLGHCMYTLPVTNKSNRITMTH